MEKKRREVGGHRLGEALLRRRTEGDVGCFTASKRRCSEGWG